MLKKLFLALSFIAVVVCYAKADFGVSVEGGGVLTGSNNLDKIEIPKPNGGSFSLTRDESTGSPGGWLIALFYDVPDAFGLGEKHSVGAKLGYSAYENTSIYTDLYAGSPLTLALLYDVKSEIYSIPFTIYYKYDLSGKWKVWAGTGLSFITNKWIINTVNLSRTNSETKVVPHLATGIEWQFSQLFGLELNLGYQFDAKFKSGLYFDGKEIYNDVSGLLLNLAFKIHIF